MMVRTIAAVAAGFCAWMVAATLLGLGLRYAWPAYAAVEASFGFTPAMQFARLLTGAVASLAGGGIAARIAGTGGRAPLATGIVLVVFFLPVHVQLWDKFPVWYHLVFLTTLIPLNLWGGRIAGGNAK